MEISQQTIKQWGTALREEDNFHWKGAVLGWGASTSTSLRTFNIFTDNLDIYIKKNQQKNQGCCETWLICDEICQQ